jgi:DNA-binding MarR family transcriptional regulator/GNAT superfamily N-acetyltransferase
MKSLTDNNDRIVALRAFNRFWTAKIGVLDDRLHASAYSLSEARVLYELAQRDALGTGELKATLGIDAGYLSRILARFKRDKLVTAVATPTDRRCQTVALTAKGRGAFRDLDARANADVTTLLAKVSADAQRDLTAAMATIRTTLADPTAVARGYVLRAPRPGDLGWVVERNGALYAAEYGWDDTYEALVARIVADFVAKRDPVREAAWIAELDGQRVGCVFCVAKSARVAQLRLLLVEPSARGLGIGRALVAECIAHARRCGFAKLVLWTNDVLHSARKIYEAAGFQLVSHGKHQSFGHDLVEQTWELDLATRAA